VITYLSEADMTRPLGLLLALAVTLSATLCAAPACSDVTSSTAPASQPSTQPTTQPTPALAGRWTGSARVVNDFVRATTLPVEIQIHDDLTVTGRVGDATLANGRLISNRGSLARAAGLGRDYEIRADLDGLLIAAEQVRRDGVTIVFDLDASGLHGGLTSTGTKVGGKNVVQIAAGKMRLARLGTTTQP
jgi:hypothetical protein